LVIFLLGFGTSLSTLGLPSVDSWRFKYGRLIRDLIRMMTRRTTFVALAVIAVLSFYGIKAYMGSQSVRELQGVEVREYQGEKLGSIGDFRENSIRGPQDVDVDSYVLRVTGMVEEPRNYTYGEVLDGFQGYEKVATIDCVEGWSVKVLWEGVLVSEVLDVSGVSPDANTVIFHAEDGYTTSLPLEYIFDNEILMAYNMNGRVLPTERGFPYQLVAESKWGYKWIKWITEIELSDDREYRGYWESRGYSNDADLDGSYWGN
jgi:DMSO/TMAO reductase YedYZ molybdopterin-dependent catalytic subunit